MMYRTCPDCGASLDPQERCDCDGQQIKKAVVQTTTPNDGATRSKQNQLIVATIIAQTIERIKANIALQEKRSC